MRAPSLHEGVAVRGRPDVAVPGREVRTDPASRLDGVRHELAVDDTDTADRAVRGGIALGHAAVMILHDRAPDRPRRAVVPQGQARPAQPDDRGPRFHQDLERLALRTGARQELQGPGDPVTDGERSAAALQLQRLHEDGADHRAILVPLLTPTPAARSTPTGS